MAKTLIVQNLTLIKNNKLICTKLNWTIGTGQQWGIIGLNGSGKTTLLQTLAGLQKTPNESIYLDNISLHKLSRKQIAKNIGILLQEENYPFPLLVHDILQSGFYAHSKKNFIKESDFLIQKLKLGHLLNRSILSLSGGEKRRVGIGRLLLQEPEIYLLDEPCNHLDVFFQKMILSHFKKLSQNHSATVILSSHDFKMINYFCEFVLMLLPDGEILMGEKKDILTKKNFNKLNILSY